MGAESSTWAAAQPPRQGSALLSSPDTQSGDCDHGDSWLSTSLQGRGPHLTPIFVNKVLLGDRHVRSVIYCSDGSQVMTEEPIVRTEWCTAKLKTLAAWLFTENLG